MNSETEIKEPRTSRESGQPKRRSLRRFLWITLAVLVLAAGAFVYVRYYFVFGTGVKAGTLIGHKTKGINRNEVGRVV